MLTIRRKRNQGVYIGDSFVRILSIDDHSVNLGIYSNELVLREELLEGDRTARRRAYECYVDGDLDNVANDMTRIDDRRVR